MGSCLSLSAEGLSQKTTPKSQTLQNQRFVGFFHLDALHLISIQEMNA